MKQAFGNILGKARQHLYENRTRYFLVFMIFLLGFGTRAYLMRYELPFEFDSYWHARMLSYMVQDGFVPDIDPITYWNFPGGMSIDKSSELFWRICAVMYGIFTLGSPVYSKGAIILVMNIAPALFGALAAVGVFFLIKEIYGPKPAYAAAILAAVMPAFVYRTMAGFFEPTSIGFMWIAFGFYFLAKSANTTQAFRKGLVYGALSGLMFGLMALSWKGFMFVIPIFIVSGVLVALNIFSKKPFAEFKNFVLYFIIALAIFFGFGWISIQSAMLDIPANIMSTFFGTLVGENFTMQVVGLVVLIAIVGVVLSYLWKFKEDSQAKAIVSYFRLLAIIAIIGIAFYAVTSGKNFGSAGVIGTSIGEESPGNLYFGNKYNMLFFFFFAALVIIPLKDFFDKRDVSSPIVLVLVVVTFFLAWTKLKFTFLFGLPLAVSAAPLFWLVLNMEKPGLSAYKKLGALFLGFCLLVGVAAGSFFVSQQVPNIETSGGWKEALKWVSVNTPEDARILNWWDEGHWVGFIGERGAIIDNRNMDGESRTLVALLLITQDVNEAETMIRQTNPDYLLLGDDLLQKQRSLAQYAYNVFDDPRIKDTFGISFGCGKNVEPVSGTTTYNCGGNNLNDAQYNNLPATWTGEVTQFLDDRNPVLVYRNEKNDRLFVVNPETNNTFFAKLWFHEPNVFDGKFEEVYSVQGVKVFKVL